MVGSIRRPDPKTAAVKSEHYHELIHVYIYIYIYIYMSPGTINLQLVPLVTRKTLRTTIGVFFAVLNKSPSPARVVIYQHDSRSASESSLGPISAKDSIK
jgi:hypothetical protein